MNQKTGKKLKEFTDKQRKSLKAVMKKISEGKNYKCSKRKLIWAIRESGAYNRKHDATKTLKMFLKNPNTPLELEKGGTVVRTDMVAQ